MIDYNFLHYKTKAAFDSDCNQGLIKDDCIVFIKDEKLIWTHGTFYHGSEDVNIIVDSILSASSTNPVQNSTIKNAIDQLEAYLQNQINELKNAPQGDGFTHVVLSQEQYNALQTYGRNTIYFIVNTSNWTFGDTFPATFTSTAAEPSV